VCVVKDRSDDNAGERTADPPARAAEAKVDLPRRDAEELALRAARAPEPLRFSVRHVGVLVSTRFGMWPEEAAAPVGSSADLTHLEEE
jgi:hypothetical protein